MELLAPKTEPEHRKSSTCRDCGRPADVAVQLAFKKRGRVGRQKGGLIKAFNFLLCHSCAEKHGMPPV